MSEKKSKSGRSFELGKTSTRKFNLDKASTRKFELSKEDDNGLSKLKAELLADGVIDKEEVQQLRTELYADGIIDKEEAEFLFELNDAVSGKGNSPEWDKFFVEAVSDFLLKDETSPGEIDEDEAKWLIEKIGADGKVDGVEKELLLNLNKEAKAMPASLKAVIAQQGLAPKKKEPAKKESAKKEEPAQKEEPAKKTGNKPQKEEGKKPSPTPVHNEPAGDGEVEGGSSKKWLWILLALIVVAMVVFFGMKSCNGNKADTSSNQTENVMAEGTDSTDQAQTDSLATENNGEEVAEGKENAEGKAQTTEDESGANAAATQTDAQPTASKTNAQLPESKTATQQSASQPSAQPASSNASDEEMAQFVIRGDYGNGEERKLKLGDRYRTIQNIVNRIYREKNL